MIDTGTNTNDSNHLISENGGLNNAADTSKPTDASIEPVNIKDDFPGPPTPKYLKRKTLPTHDVFMPDFPHLLDVIDPDAKLKAHRYTKQPMEIALDQYFDFDDSPPAFESEEAKLKRVFDYKNTNPMFEKEVLNIYQEMERRRGTPYEMVGRSAEMVRRNTPGGWNSCTKT